jgi:hypothetical protein
MQSDRELEEMIDAAIPGYSEAEPRPGFEQRILTRALAEKPRRQRFAWQWSFAIPAIACLLILFLHTWRRNPPSQTYASAAKNIATTPAPTVTVVSSPPERHNADNHPRRIPLQDAKTSHLLPEQDVFPAPTPLTAEEGALLAHNHAQFIAMTTRPAGQLEIDPLLISELQIKPLDVPALDPPTTSESHSSQNEQQP